MILVVSSIFSFFLFLFSLIFFFLLTAFGCSGREEDQISGGSAGGNSNEEA